MSSSFHGVVYQTSDVDYTPVPLNAVTVQISAIDSELFDSFVSPPMMLIAIQLPPWSRLSRPFRQFFHLHHC